MKIHLEQFKAKDKFHGNNSGFADSGFVKTCDELVKGFQLSEMKGQRQMKNMN